MGESYNGLNYQVLSDYLLFYEACIKNHKMVEYDYFLHYNLGST